MTQVQPNTALLLIDFQNDYFPGGKWELTNTQRATDNGAKLLAAFRQKQMPVIHVRHEFETDEAPFFTPGSQGAQIHSSVAAVNDEPVILKHSANSFKETDLQEILKSRNIENLIVAGAMSHMCIDAGVRAAADLGYNVTVAQDACATMDQEFNGITIPAEQVHASFMAALGFAYARVEDTEILLEEMK
ncbi:Nicotinamidase-related amidase [Amphritea atlantica]|uniref:Nicotinamidase-related amidase n=1 Tax=Amphritea atlantica TaxID=355243 RepID=A0A1H9JJ46_9GAMM|nr:cysteine hydrolase family protein [Amphritea atlantica]SEQ86856.1 Nicotinamidase-related amidase [Amphritea atlantica]